MNLRLETVRAKAGATLLDLLQPGWAARINLGTLDLSDCQACVLGQLFGEYTKGAETIFAMRSAPDGEWETDRFNNGVKLAANEAGFAADRSPTGEKYGKWTTYPKLTLAWKREITKRLPKVAVVNAGKGVYCDLCKHANCTEPVTIDRDGTIKARKQVPA